MALNLTPDARAALDLAKQAVPEDSELDVGLLMAALYHSTPLKSRLPPSLGHYLQPPKTRRETVPDKVPLAKPLQPLLAQLLNSDRMITAEAFFQALLNSEAGRACLLKAGMAETDLQELVNALQTAPAGPLWRRQPASGWRGSPQRQTAIEALNSFGRMLTAAEPPYRGVYGMDDTLRALLRTLSRMNNRSAVIIGQAGVGKSAVVYELARRLYHGDPSIPPHLRELDIFELSPVFLRSGASMVGQYDERIKALIQVLEAHPQIVPFVDEIHSLFRSGMHERDPFSDANEAFKGKLATGAITCLGCTTFAEYRHYIEPDPALARRFTVIRLEPPTPAVTVRILQARRPRLEAYFSPPPLPIPDAVLECTVQLTEEYLPTRFQPAKSLQLLDEACAYCVTSEPRLEQVTEEALWHALEDMIGHSVVRAEELTEAALYQRLQSRIIGQEETLRAVGRVFIAGLGGWAKRSGPRGVFFFCGPTGVGKTETAVLLSQVLGGGPEALTRVNCNTLQGSGYDSGPAINVLLGAPPGYAGYVRGAGGLLSNVRDQPECIVLFDEIEKADPGVAKLLLQIMDDGRLEDNDGNLLDFRRAFLIFTTNAGTVYRHNAIGFTTDTGADPDIPTVAIDAVKDELRSLGYGEEFFGRVDDFFIFQGLRADAIRRIIDLQLDRLRAGADVRGYALAWDAAVVDYLASRWQPRFGVRHLTTILRNRIVEQLAVAEAQRELKGIKHIRLRALALNGAAAGGELAGLATRERDGETLWINLT